MIYSIPLALAVLGLQTSTTAKPAANPLEAVTIYSGSWTITGPSTMAGPGKPDHVIYHCLLADAYYTCEQVVNGKPLAMVVFTPGESPDSFHTQIILPDGHATGRGDLIHKGDQWTWLTKPLTEAGKGATWYRTENIFTGRDRIHYDSYESTDGITWVKKSFGDEQRLP